MRRQAGASALWIVGIIGVVVIVFGAVFASRFGVDPDLVASPLIGEPAPDRRMPYMETTGDLSLADLEGDIVVVNFWASWCPGCRDEHGGLAQAASDYADAGVTFVGVLHQDSPANGSAFLDDFGRGEPYRYVVDEGSRAGISFGILGLPTTFFLDRTGTIVGQVNGPVSYGLVATSLDAILLGSEIDPLTETGDLQNR